MKEIDQDNLDTAIALGDAVCNQLGICCDKRGRVIFQIYKKLEELKPRPETLGKSDTSEAHAEQNIQTKERQLAPTNPSPNE